MLNITMFVMSALILQDSLQSYVTTSMSDGSKLTCNFSLVQNDTFDITCEYPIGLFNIFEEIIFKDLPCTFTKNLCHSNGCMFWLKSCNEDVKRMAIGTEIPCIINIEQGKALIAITLVIGIILVFGLIVSALLRIIYESIVCVCTNTCKKRRWHFHHE